MNQNCMHEISKTLIYIMQISREKSSLIFHHITPGLLESSARDKLLQFVNGWGFAQIELSTNARNYSLQ